MDITNRQLQSTWLKSERIDFLEETFGDEPVIIPEGFVSVTLEDLINKKITKKNYLDIVKLADFMMVDNVDPIVDAIVRVTKNIDVVYEFPDFYGLSERLKPLTKEKLKEQIRDYTNTYRSSTNLQTTKLKMFKKYGHSNFWNVSQITNMSGLFYYSQFPGEISKWDVSQVTEMSDMFYESNCNPDISEWNVSNVTDMRSMFANSKFTGNILKWNVSNVKTMNKMFFGSIFNNDLSEWDVSNVTDMNEMFKQSKFNNDI